MRSPQNPRTAVFPGNVLTLSGTGVWTNSPSTNYGGVAELRFKQPNPGTVIFNRLVMNGGQLDAGNDGIVVIGGRMDIVKNAPIYNDGGGDRGYRIDAWVTGNADIEYHGYNQSAFMPTYVNNLNITGTSNTFSGKWNVVAGTLLGTGTNSLGTNSIFIGTNAAFQTTYDINSPQASLSVFGRMYLTQNDTFRSVYVGGAPLAVGSVSLSSLGVLAADGVSVDFGPSAADVESAHFNRLAVLNSRESVLVIDHTKFTAPSLFKIVDWDRISRIVTDKQPDNTWMSFFEARGISVVTQLTAEATKLSGEPPSSS